MAGDDDLPVEAPEADALDQRRSVSDESEGDTHDVLDGDSLEVPEADALDQARIVGGLLAAGRLVGGFEDGTAEALWRLDGAQLAAVQGLDDQGVAGSYALDRVGDRDARHHGVGPGAYGGSNGVDEVRRDERARGVDPWEAVIEATKHRFRPIMLTAAAAILGMIPIMHDVFWGPMAYAIVGGLAVATALTLVFLPALYVAVNGIREKDEPAAAADVAAEHSLALQS